MATIDDLTESFRKVFLIGVGSVATGFEKSQELIDDLVSKGEITLEQGKELNAELSRKVKETVNETVNDTSEAALRSRLKNMTPEQRVEWLKRANQIVDDIDAETVEVEVEDASEDDADK